MRKLGKILLMLGLAAQALVPAWMLTKRHLILTQGELVTVPVTLRDPRDLFMGHYVQLSLEETPPALKDIPTNYLRYYCDQRYARPFEKAILGGHEAELDVRVWRGTALAADLRIGGVPAYAYVKSELKPEPEANAPVETFKAFVRLPRTLPEVILDKCLWQVRDYVQAANVGYATLPIIEAELWRTVRELLLIPEREAVATSAEVYRRRRLLRLWSAELACGARAGVFPLFSGLPFSCEAPPEEQAHAYYSALKAIYDFPEKYPIVFEGAPAPFALEKALSLARKVFPKARYLVAGAAVPEGFPPEQVVHLLPKAPETPPEGMAWTAQGKAPTLVPMLKLAKRTPEALRARLANASEKMPYGVWRDNLLETFAAHALARYEETHNPEALRIADALLCYHRTHSLYFWFERCDTYAAYIEFLRWLRDITPKGQPVPLGGWLEAEANLPKPPEPQASGQSLSKETLHRLVEPLLTL